MVGYCTLCAQQISEDVETHINQQHSDPTLRVRDVGGEDREMTDADWIRLNASGGGAGQGGPAVTTLAPTPSIFESLGIRMQDLEAAESEVDAGASCSENEAKKVFEAVERHAGFKVDRAHFLINFIDWGIRTGFSEELSEAGGWVVRSAPTAGSKSMFVRAQDLHATIRDHLGDAATGRDFTFRRLGRTFARQIPTLVQRNKALGHYAQYGSDMSNRLGVAPGLFLTCTSIFESIKPYAKWSDDELAAWRAHNASVTKVARDSRRRPEDLRIDPEGSIASKDSGYHDWAQRVSERYPRGAATFERMWSKDDKRGPGDTRGLGS